MMQTAPAARNDMPGYLLRVDHLDPLSLTAVAMWLFALWTVSCNVMVFTGGSLWSILRVFGSLAGIVAACVCAVGIRRLLAATPPAPGVALPANDTRGERFALLVLSVLALIVTLAACRPDADDSYFVGMAVSSVSRPTEPVLREVLPVYRVQSLELLTAALSLVTGIPPIVFGHLLVPALASILTVLAYAQLFRVLVPRYWLLGIATVMVFLVVDGAVHTSYGNFAFVRLHQGKGIFVSACVPLLLCYTLQFVARPSLVSGSLLFCTQVSSVGFTCNALWIGPAVTLATLGALCFCPQTRPKPHVLLHGTLCCLYPVVLAALVRCAWAPSSVFPTVLRQESLMMGSLAAVFGTGASAVGSIVLALLAFASCRSPLRSFLAAYLLIIAVVFLCPPWNRWLANTVTGTGIYWRFLWIVPFPAIATLGMLSPFLIGRNTLTPVVRIMTYAALMAVLVFILPAKTTLSKNNGTTMGWPGLKVPSEYWMAEDLVRWLPPAAVLLAPEDVALWVPAFPGHPGTVLTRLLYCKPDDPITLFRCISGLDCPTNGTVRLADDLPRLGVTAVCVARSNPWVDEIRRQLGQLGFSRRGSILGNHELWMRPPVR